MCVCVWKGGGYGTSGPSPGGERREVPQASFVWGIYFDQLVYNRKDGEFVYKKGEKKNPSSR